MSLPASTIIIGGDPVAQAVCQVLELFGIRCYKYSTIPDGGSNLDFTKHLNDSDLAIAIAPSADRVITQVHQLRSVDPYHWAGNFIAVVNDQAQKEELLRKSLFGQSNYKLYGQDQWHKVITLSSPRFFVNLLVLINSFWTFPIPKSEKLDRYKWNNFHRRSKVGIIRQELEKIKTEKRNSQKIVFLREALNVIQALDWSTVNHTAKNEIINPLLNIKEINEENHLAVLNKIKELLSKSLF